ncbi:hypothetical protein JCM11251_002913 [Rhodosporidiobolus azoricus]
MQALEPVLSNESASSLVEVGDYEFCMHGHEQCRQCGVDYREDNSFTGSCSRQSSPFSEIEVGLVMKDGEPTCTKHKTVNCGTCFNNGTFKKQINKLTKEGVKRAKQEAKMNPKSNLFA